MVPSIITSGIGIPSESHYLVVFMKSYWSIACEGTRSGILIKKFERVLCIKVMEPETERVILDNKKLEVVDFFIDNPSVSNWNDLVMDILKNSAKLSSRWSICIADENLSGLYDPQKNHETASISGLYKATWHILNSQAYTRVKLLGNRANMW